MVALLLPQSRRLHTPDKAGPGILISELVTRSSWPGVCSGREALEPRPALPGPRPSAACRRANPLRWWGATGRWRRTWRRSSARRTPALGGEEPSPLWEDSGVSKERRERRAERVGGRGSLFTQRVDDSHSQPNAQEHEGPAGSSHGPGLHTVVLVRLRKNLLQGHKAVGREASHRQNRMRRSSSEHVEPRGSTQSTTSKNLCRELLQVQDLQSVACLGFVRQQLVSFLLCHNTDLEKKNFIN